MELCYHRVPLGNFGDDLNLWLWDELLPGWRDWAADSVLVGVGTLLNTDLERRVGPGRRFLVAGSGVGYAAGLPDVSDRDRWDIRSVRGPLSAQGLGLPAGKGLIDPAAMIPTLPAFRGIPRAGRPIFVPHSDSVERHDWAAACAAAGLDYVSPQGDSRKVIARLAGAPLVLAESMHAAIIADAFRTPWIPVRIGYKFLPFKWEDWAMSVGVTLGDIPPLFALEERLFALARTVIPRRRQEKAAPEAGTAAPDASERGPRRPGTLLKLQTAVESRRIVSALKYHLSRPPMVSDDAMLERKRAAYSAVLEGICRDYA
jgi:succinoglycan biosynthesis protein ExoV